MRWYIRDIDDGTICGPYADYETTLADADRMDNSCVFSSVIFGEDLSSPKKVVLTVCGGVVECDDLPAGVEIDLLDYDCDGYDERALKTDETGKRYLLIQFGGQS